MPRVEFKTVDEFMDQLDDNTQKIVLSLQSIIKQTEPKLTEHIKWNSPSYVLDGEDRITFNVRPGFPVIIVLHMGATRPEDKNGTPIIEDSAGIVEWKSDTRGLISFKTIDEVEQKRVILTDLLTRWLRVK